MEKPNNKLYFPLFYKYGALFSAMPMEEVGKLYTHKQMRGDFEAMRGA